MIVVVWVFYFSVYVLLFRILANWRWAAYLSVFLLIANFYTSHPFWAPSVWVIRFPLLIPFIFLFVKSARDSTILNLNRTCLAVCIGSSIFWNTETGTYMALCALAGTFVARKFQPSVVWELLELTIIALLSFFVLSVAFFGSGVLKIGFLLKLYEPLFFYGSGFGAWLVNWSYGADSLIISPLILLLVSTTGFAAVQVQRSALIESETALFLLIISMLGICLLLKWVNMSLSAVWLSSAQLSFVVLAWWLNQLVLRKHWRVISAVLPLLGITFLLLYTDKRMDTDYMLRSYWEYPSLLRSALTGHVAETWPKDYRIISTKDVNLIVQNSIARQRVAFFQIWIGSIS